MDRDVKTMVWGDLCNARDAFLLLFDLKVLKPEDCEDIDLINEELHRRYELNNTSLQEL